MITTWSGPGSLLARAVSEVRVRTVADMLRSAATVRQRTNGVRRLRLEKGTADVPVSLLQGAIRPVGCFTREPKGRLPGLPLRGRHRRPSRVFPARASDNMLQSPCSRGNYHRKNNVPRFCFGMPPWRATQRFLELRRGLEQMDYLCKGTILKRMMKCGKVQCACASDVTKRHGPY